MSSSSRATIRNLIVEARDTPCRSTATSGFPTASASCSSTATRRGCTPRCRGPPRAARTGLDPKVGLGIDPTGGRLAFVRAGDLWVVDIDTRDEIAITDDGDGNTILNGCLPWVYWEELAMLGRNWASFSWSPDGRHLAFLRFDLTNVPSTRWCRPSASGSSPTRSAIHRRAIPTRCRPW